VIYTNLTRTAMTIACRAHQGQLDKAGYPYIHHPLHVAEQMTEEYTCAAALLHDVMEDTPITAEQLRAAGIPDPVVEALTLLCHDPDVPYLDYVRRLKDNPIARAVKLADLGHNSDVSRLDSVTPRDEMRLERYRRAMALLEEK
jgi:hypothetical protein